MASTAPESWQGRLAVTGLGLVTPVGLRADAATAALRAGVSRLSELPGLRIKATEEDDKPVTGGMVPELTDDRLGPARLGAMLKPAFEECIGDAGVKPEHKLGVFLGTCGSSPAGRAINYDEALRDLLLEAVPEGYAIHRAKLVQAGRASVQKSLRLAAQALEQGLVDVVVTGAVDSWVTPRALNWLHREGRLPEFPRHTGALPGEAAGFLALELPESAQARGARVYAELLSSAGRHETIQWGQAHNGLELARAIKTATADVTDAHAVLISDLDGERYRTLEWVMAEPKGMWTYRTMDHWNPADCVGDSGAAMGAVMLAWASMALHKDYAGAPRVLVWGASDEGAREAALLQAVGGAA